jgi:hypothetical protein
MRNRSGPSTKKPRSGNSTLRNGSLSYAACRDGQVEQHEKVTQPKPSADAGSINHRVAKGLEIPCL